MMGKPARKSSPEPFGKAVIPPHSIRAGRPYELAVACDTANLIDADAALALSRAAAHTLMALSPRAAQLMIAFAEDEIYRLATECSQDSQASIAIIRAALRGA